jgi:hypothetical protein
VLRLKATPSGNHGHGLEVGATHQGLWQAVAQAPGNNAWIGNGLGVPFTSLPAGTNYANAAVSVRVLLATSGEPSVRFMPVSLEEKR